MTLDKILNILDIDTVIVDNVDTVIVDYENWDNRFWIKDTKENILNNPEYHTIKDRKVLKITTSNGIIRLCIE